MTNQTQEISQAEKDRALAYLESTRKGVLDATRGLSEAQWNFKPAPDHWSLAELMEHLAVAEDLIRGRAQHVMAMPAGRARDAAELKEIDEAVVRSVSDRTHKREVPGPLRPTNRFGLPVEAQAHFLNSRADTEEYLENTSGLRAHYGWTPGSAPLKGGPSFEKLDGYEWILFVAAHSERHIKQMMEVKADPTFPEN